jgi:hypothetical protein
MFLFLNINVADLIHERTGVLFRKVDIIDYISIQDRVKVELLVS